MLVSRGAQQLLLSLHFMQFELFVGLRIYEIYMYSIHMLSRVLCVVRSTYIVHIARRSRQMFAALIYSTTHTQR